MAVWYPLLDLALSRLDAEAAHGLAICALKTGLVPGDRRPDAPSLAITIWGRSLPNPIGLAAGFDKNAEVADAMLGAWASAWSRSAASRRGRRRAIRAPACSGCREDRGVINRMGFNSHGLEAARARLAARPRRGLVGVNIGANKDSTDRAADYVTGCVAPPRAATPTISSATSPRPTRRACATCRAAPSWPAC